MSDLTVSAPRDIPKVSVVIAAKNAGATLGKCLDSLQALTFLDYEIIVVDDGSTDGTHSIAAGRSDISLLRTTGVGPAQARNDGVKIAKGEFIAFLDSDCTVEPRWIEELLKGFLDKDVAGVGGHQESPPDECEFGRKVHRFFGKVGFLTGYMHRSHRLEEVRHNASCNVMYRKSIFAEVEGFDQDLFAGEDPELDYRLREKGYRLMKNPAALVFHYRCRSLAAFGRMMFSYGCAQGQLVCRNGIFRKIQWVPLVFCAGVIAFVFIGFWDLRWAGWVAAVLFLVFLVRMSFDGSLVLLGGLAVYEWNLGFVRGFFANSSRLKSNGNKEC